MKVTDKIEITNEDNMELMARYPDNYFDLAIVDPPYGLDFTKYNRVSKASNGERYISNEYHKGNWDKSIPNDEYFKELFRVSKNQIIWGGNYFPLKPTQCFIFWYKQNPVSNFSDGELAWTSFKKPALCFDYRYYGNLSGKSSAPTKTHPTQKPIELYNFCLDKLAKEIDCKQCNNGRVIDDDFDKSTIPCEYCEGTLKQKPKILDTHLGSGSIAIACHDYGFELTACELDKEYFDKAIERIKNHTNQTKLF